MLITVFRSRLKPEVQEEYLQWASRMSDLAKSMPGYLAHKGFVADDGERVTLVEFASEEAQRSWARHPEHLAAQKKGRKDFYREFRVQVCTVQRESSYPMNDTGMRDKVSKQDSPNDVQALSRLNAGYIRSVRMSDVRWFDENLAEDFVNSNPDGSLVDREGFLAQIARPFVLSNFNAEDVRIRVIGDIAIIHGRTVYDKADGQSAAGRYTDVWSRRQGRWLCVAAHVTRG